MLAPICLFTYNRLRETQQVVTALKQNFLAPKSDLYIFSDGPKNEDTVQGVTAMRKYLSTLSGFKKITIIESDVNKGLAVSVVSGVTKVIEKYGSVIVLEDDIITTPNFLTFMNQALEFYASDRNINSVSAFSLRLKKLYTPNDVYFQKRPFPWGWATWLDRWRLNVFSKNQLINEVSLDTSVLKEFKIECGYDIVKMFMNSLYDKNDSWYVRWVYNHFKYKQYSVFPKYSLVENIGFGEFATHCNGINSYQYEMFDPRKKIFLFEKFKKPSIEIKREFLNYFTLSYKVLFRLRLLTSKIGRMQLRSEVIYKLS